MDLTIELFDSLTVDGINVLSKNSLHNSFAIIRSINTSKMMMIIIIIIYCNHTPTSAANATWYLGKSRIMFRNKVFNDS